MPPKKRVNLVIAPTQNYALLSYTYRQHIFTKKWQSSIKFTLGAVGLLLIFALPAIACSSHSNSNVDFAYQLFYLPATASILPYGIPLVAIIFTEAYILSNRESIPYLKACGFTTLANIFYLLACFVSAIFVGIIFPIYLIVCVISAGMCLSFCQRMGYLKNISKGMFTFLIYLLFMGLGFVNLFLVALISVLANPILLYAATGGILLNGFIFSFVMKGFTIAKLVREKRPTLAASVMSMQVGSFPIIAIAFYLMTNLYR